MKIENISVRILNKGNLKGFACVTFDNGLVVDDFTIFMGQNGLFAGWPKKKSEDGEFRPLVATSDKALYKSVCEAIVLKYKEELGNSSPDSAKPKQQGAVKTKPRKSEEELFE